MGWVASLAATAVAVSAIPALEVVEAVVPAWPAGVGADVRGTVEVEFLHADRTILSASARPTRLAPAFVAESVASLQAWLIDQADVGTCGHTRAIATFVFDSSQADKVELLPLTVLDRPTMVGLARMDRIEVSAGRIKRELRAQHQELRAAQVERERARDEATLARWSALGRPRPMPFVPDGVAPPVPTTRIEPQYPSSALMNGVQAEVAAVMRVGANGSVYEVRVVGSTSRRTFDEATRKALRRWKFEPARTPAGEAIESEVCQLISYRLYSID